MIRVGRLSNASALALAARPDMATTGKAAAATTTPASSPQMSNEVALVSTLRSRLRIQVTGTGYATALRTASSLDPARFPSCTALTAAFVLVAPLSTARSPGVAVLALLAGNRVAGSP